MGLAAVLLLANGYYRFIIQFFSSWMFRHHLPCQLQRPWTKALQLDGLLPAQNPQRGQAERIYAQRQVYFSSSYQNKNGKLRNLLPTLGLPWQHAPRFTAERNTPITDVNPAPQGDAFRAPRMERFYEMLRIKCQPPHRQKEEMVKVKAKVNSCEDSAPAQPLRSRKRESPSDETSLTADVKAAVHQQDTKGKDTAVVATSLEGCNVMITHQQDQAAEQSCFTKQDGSTKEEHTEAVNEANDVHLTNVAVTQQEETTVTNPKSDSQPGILQVQTENDTTKGGKGKKEIALEECKVCTDQLQIVVPISEDADRSCGAALEKQLGEEGTSLCNLDGNQETSQDKPSDISMDDFKEPTKESAVGLPAKKKRRMGVCGLTEKERSHFLLAQKRENGQNGTENVEKQICNNTAELVAAEERLSSPRLPLSPRSIQADNITEQREAEFQSSLCGGDDSAKPEVCANVTTSDETDTACDPEVKSCEAEGGIVLNPEEHGQPDMDQLAEEEEGEHMANPELLKRKRSVTEAEAEIPEKQMKTGEDGPADVDCDYDTTVHKTQNEGSDSLDVIKVDLLQVNSVTRAREEERDETAEDTLGGDGADAGASFGETQSGSVELCEAAVTPSVSERKDRSDPDTEPAAGPGVNTEHTEAQDTDTADQFGFICSDFVSDSQLNTIVLTEEKVLKKDKEPDFLDHHEDATNLICGLIRELSSLNRKVMATHRELEILRRSNKSSRSSMC